MNKIKFLREPENGFYNTLKNKVASHFREQQKNRFATGTAIVKALLFAGIFLALYLIILLVKMPGSIYLSCWFLMGSFMLFTAMSMVHDAAHNAFSKKKWVNQLLLRFANLAGGDGYMYKYKHTVSHHPYTNIPGIDIDLEQTAMVRVTPYTKSSRKHKYQHWYMKVFYPFYILFWVLVRDFKYYRLKKIGLVQAHHKTVHRVLLCVSKVFYIFYMLFLPIWLSKQPWWMIVAGFFLMQIGAGIVAMFALLSNHVVEDSVFVMPDDNGIIQCSWGEHQLRTTDDYSPDSKFISYMFSGLNHHVAHHLFPNYCHVHYPAITKIVRATAHEFGLRYRYNSITGGLGSHFRLLKKLSKTRLVIPKNFTHE